MIHSGVVGERPPDLPHESSRATLITLLVLPALPFRVRLTRDGKYEGTFSFHKTRDGGRDPGRTVEGRKSAWEYSDTDPQGTPVHRGFREGVVLRLHVPDAQRRRRLSDSSGYRTTGPDYPSLLTELL